jgi:hypothetical protein
LTDTLVVAFDGLDKELIEKFGLKNITQEEFGSIDNETGMSRIMTSELFASFVTGTNHQEHGAQGFHYYEGLAGKLIRKTVGRASLVQNVRGFQRVEETLLTAFKVQKKRYSKEDLKVDSLFEKIDNSRAMFVPGYNPDMFWETGCESQPLNYGYNMDEYLNFWDTRAYRYRKESLMNEISFMSRPLLMCHFHRPDLYQHVYGDKEIGYDEEKLLKIYRETDKLAEEIKEEALDSGYDRVIFMSDHGLPKGKDHNRNAFYSCNKKIFPNKTPLITDFHDRILEIVGEQDTSSEVSEGEDGGLSKEQEEEVKKNLEDMGYI